jgi:hypothetical protein
LWEVADAPATPQLMEALCRELGEGKDPGSALPFGHAFAASFCESPFGLEQALLGGLPALLRHFERSTVRARLRAAKTMAAFSLLETKVFE